MRTSRRLSVSWPTGLQPHPFPYTDMRAMRARYPPLPFPYTGMMSLSVRPAGIRPIKSTLTPECATGAALRSGDA